MGKEIEGESQLGELTLFVRKGLHFPAYLSKVVDGQRITRVWFCKEMLPYLEEEGGLSMLSAMREFAPEVTLCFEVPLSQLPNYHMLRQFGRLYIKFDLIGLIKAGDTLCFGPPYSDRFLEVPEDGAKVVASQYLEDICLEA